MRRQFFYLASLFVAGVLGLSSCGGDGESFDAPKLDEPAYAADAAKYTSGTKYVELTGSGQYLINPTGQTRAAIDNYNYYGSYTKNSDGTYTLQDFPATGQTSILTIVASNAGYNLNITGPSNYSFANCSKTASDYTSNSNTAFLCRRWKVAKISYKGTFKCQSTGKTVTLNIDGVTSAKELGEKWNTWYNANKANLGDMLGEMDAEDQAFDEIIFTTTGTWIEKSDTEYQFGTWKWRSAASIYIWSGTESVDVAIADLKKELENMPAAYAQTTGVDNIIPHFGVSASGNQLVLSMDQSVTEPETKNYYHIIGTLVFDEAK